MAIPTVHWLNQVSLARFALVASCLGCLSIFGYAFCVASDVELIARDASRSAAELELIEELQLLRATWDPEKKARILEGAPEFQEKFAGPLSRLLRLEDQDLLEQAVVYAGALGVPAVRPELVALVRARDSLPPRVRMAAIRSAERLAPWSTSELSDFLVDGSFPIKLAALELCAHRSDSPWPEILPFLAAGPVEQGEREAVEVLREAAIRTVPRRPSAEALRDIWSMVTVGEARCKTAALRALARVEPAAELRAKLIGHLDLLDGEALVAGLSLVQRWGLGAAEAVPLWSLVQRQDVDLAIRVRTLACLESTRSYDAQALRAARPAWPPLLQHFAARCLLASGEAEGFLWLLDLIEMGDGATVAQTRQLLAFLTGRAPGSTRADFEASMAFAMKALPSRALPQPLFAAAE